MTKLVSTLAVCLAVSSAVAQVPCYVANLGTQLTLTDDSFSGVLPLGFTFNYGGVAYTDVQVCSNGFIVFGAGAPGSPDFSPTVNELLNNPEARVCPIWRDLNPAATGSGQVWYNAVPAAGSSPAYFSVTYDGVFQFGTSNPISAQIVFIDGDTIQMNHDVNVLNGTNNWVLGASPGNGALANPVTFSALPIITAGNPTLHEDGSGGFAVSDSVMQWTPDGATGYNVVPVTNCAETEKYGDGCVAQFASVYEFFANSQAFDLSNTAITGLFTGNSYVITQGTTTFVAPGVGASNLGLPDDGVATVAFSGSLTFPYPGGTTPTLEVCSNGFVSVANNGQDFSPTVAEWLAWASPAWSVWHDFTPNGTNNVLVEEIAGILYVTWDAVPTYQNPNPNTFQFQFDTNTGFFHIVFQQMDNVASTTLGDQFVVGYTPANGAGDPGSVDLTPVTMGSQTLVTFPNDIIPLSLCADAPPVVNSTINLVVDNITPTAPVGGILYGITRIQPGVDLSGFGMPGCFQYNDQVASRLFFPAGASSVSVPFVVPNIIAIVQCQAAVYDPTAALTPLGAVSSNGVELSTGN